MQVKTSTWSVLISPAEVVLLLNDIFGKWMWHQSSTVSRAQSEGNENHKLDSLAAQDRDVSSLYLICGLENQAIVLESAFWEESWGRHSFVFACFLCPVMWRKLAGRFFLYYCCLWHNPYIILEPFEKPVYSSIARFHCARVEHHVALGEAQDSLQCPERGVADFRICRICQNLHRQHRIPRAIGPVFMQSINFGSWKVGFQNHINADYNLGNSGLDICLPTYLWSCKEKNKAISWERKPKLVQILVSWTEPKLSRQKALDLSPAHDRVLCRMRDREAWVRAVKR